jgi:hypothetical protein
MPPLLLFFHLHCRLSKVFLSLKKIHYLRGGTLPRASIRDSPVLCGPIIKIHHLISLFNFCAHMSTASIAGV